MPRDAYFSFGDEEPDGPPVATAPEIAKGSLGAVGVADPISGERLGAAEGSLRVPTRGGAPRRGSRERRRPSLTPARLAALLALILAVVLIGRALAGAVAGGSTEPHGVAATHGVAERPGARVLAPSRPGIGATGESRAARRHAAEQERAERRRSQTRRRARRHRERRSVERRNLAAGSAEPAPESPATQPVEAPAPPATQSVEVPASPEVPPSYTPPPTEPAPEPAPEPPSPPPIQNGAHSPEFGL